MKYKTGRINVIKNAIIERTYSSREVVTEVEVESEKKYRKESNLETKKKSTLCQNSRSRTSVYMTIGTGRGV